MSKLTPAAVALNDLIATMEAIQRLYDKAPLSEAEDSRLCTLEDRRSGLERQLQREVSEKLGIDYALLWHAVTPTGPIPKLPGQG
jgi:hypothetical protein